MTTKATALEPREHEHLYTLSRRSVSILCRKAVAETPPTPKAAKKAEISEKAKTAETATDEEIFQSALEYESRDATHARVVQNTEEEVVERFRVIPAESVIEQLEDDKMWDRNCFRDMYFDTENMSYSDGQVLSGS